MILTLNERLEAEGPRVAPEPETAEEYLARSRRPSRLVALVSIFVALAGTLLGLDELGLVEFPAELLLAAFTLMLVVETVFAVIGLRDRDEDDDD